MRTWLTSAEVEAGALVKETFSDAEWDALNDAVLLYDLKLPTTGRRAKLHALHKDSDVTQPQ